uniref:GIY-YIG nuclease family protein n=1 Tax=Flavobacterium sp. TaxID=239 RepID=UPI00404B2442
MPINYQEGKVYKIYNTINDDIYVGSTTQKLCERMRDHRYCINNQKKKDRLLYQAFREHGVCNFRIELIEKCPCNDKDELRRTEGKYIRELKPYLNMNIAGRTCKEYHNDHREQLKEHKKQYAEQHKEYFKAYFKAYSKEEITCECGRMIARGHLRRHQRSMKHLKLMNDKLN